MQATMRKIGALCQKDFIDMFKNPSMLVCLIMPIGFAVLFRYMLSDVGVATVGEDPNAAGAAVGPNTRYVRVIIFALHGNRYGCKHGGGLWDC